MIQNIVFDMGNVLIRYDIRHYVNGVADDEQDRLLLMREVFGGIEWLQMDRGVLEDTEAVISVCARLPKRLHQAAEQLVYGWHSDIPLYPDMEKLVQELKSAGYGIYLLSNTSKKFHTFRRGIPALRHFDGTFISADHLLMKPDPAIYHMFFRQFGLAPSACFFVDDSVANVESALHTGMPGFVFRGDVMALRAALRAAGVTV